MQPGQVLIWRKFKCKDGTIIDHPKYFVILAINGSNYLMVKTTSKIKRKTRNPGCNLQIPYDNYFIPQGSVNCFPEDTWIQLDEVHESVIPSEGDISLKLILDEALTKRILVCTINSGNITTNQCKLLKSTHANL